MCSDEEWNGQSAAGGRPVLEQNSSVGPKVGWTSELEILTVRAARTTDGWNAAGDNQ